MLEALRPDPLCMVAALLIALAMDLAYPEHRGLSLRLHPVHTSYFMALALAKPHGGRLRGVLVWLAVVALHAVPPALVLLAAYRVSPALWTLAAAAILKVSASLRLLLRVCRGAYASLVRRELSEARRWVQMIVRRDVSRLDEPLVVSACVESLAESLVDGFTSPLLYYALLGPLGALIQRVANTLDGAIGYRTPEYARVGWFSARADTAINYVPARLTAVTMALLSPLVGGSVAGALRVWARCSGATESLNAGHPMSAMAGALGVRLEKPGHYVINGEARYPGPGDIAKALRLASAAAVVHVILALVIIALLG